MPTMTRSAAHPLALVIAGLLCGVALAQGARLVTPPPGPLPPRVPANALFHDDFSSGTGKWTFDADSVWSVHWGMLCASLPDGRQLRSFAYAGSEDWTDYAVDLDVCQMRGVDKGVVVRVKGSSGIGVDARGPGYQDVLLYRREIPLGHAHAPSPNGVWHHLRVEVRGGRTRVFLDGALVIDHGDERGGHGTGRIALPAYTGGSGQCTVYYDNVLVTPLD